MADETKKYLVNIESNLKKYAEEAALAKKNVDALKVSNEELKKSGATPAEIEESNAALKNANAEYAKAQKMVQLQTAANSSEAGSRKQLSEILRLQEQELAKLGNAYIKNQQGILQLNPLYTEQRNKIAATKQAIIDYDLALNDGRSNIGRYGEAIQGAIGKFSAIPGPVGQAASAVTGFGTTIKTLSKTLLATPLGWLMAGVAALVAVFTGLFKVFKSTADGAGKIKDVMASLHAILDVLRNRVVSLMDAFGHLFKGEFKKAGEDIKATFTGVGTAIAVAAGNAAELSRKQRELTKDLAMHVSEEANENLKMQEYLMLSKDKTKSDKERVEYLKQAMALSEEKAKKEVEYAQRQFNIDIGNAALKAEIDQKTLADWIAMDAEQQKIALAGSEKLRNAYNLLGGSDALKTLEESFAKITNAQAEFFQTNKRTTSQLSTLENELAKERETRIKEQISLRELQAKGDIESEKKALKFKYDAEIKMTDVSNTQKLILKKQYEEAVAALDKLALDEFEVKENKKKEILKTTYEYELNNLNLNEAQKESVRNRFNAAIGKIDQDIADKRKVLLQRSLSDDLGLTEANNRKKIEAQKRYQDEIAKLPAGKAESIAIKSDLKAKLDLEIQALNDANTMKLSLYNKYENDVKAIQSKKLSKTETDKQIADLTDKLRVQFAKIKQYEEDVSDLDKQTLANKKTTLKTSLDIAIKAIEDEKKLYIESKKENNQELNAKQLYDLEKKTQDDILKLKSSYLDESSKLDAAYYAKQKTDLEAQLQTNLILFEDNEKAKQDLRVIYDAAILEIDKQAAITAQNRLLQEVADAKATDEAKRQIKIASGEWDKERLLIDEENRLQIMELTNQSEFEIQRRRLETQYNAEILNAKKTGASIQLINQKYSEAKRKLDKLELESRLSLFADFAGNLANLLGKETALGRAAAVAQATINTYLSASKAYAAMSAIPPAPVWGIAAAALAVADGLITVKKILSVKSGLPGDSGGGGASLPTAISASAPHVTGTAVGSSILTQPQLSQTQLNAIPQQVSLTADDIAKALAKMPAPVVTVEDINVRQASVNKVAVRANI